MWRRKFTTYENVPVLRQREITLPLSLAVAVQAHFRVVRQVVDSLEIGGVPQHRERVYVVGWKRSLGASNAFTWPRAVNAPLLSDALDGSSKLCKDSVMWGGAAGATRLCPTAQANLRRVLLRIADEYDDNPLIHAGASTSISLRSGVMHFRKNKAPR